MVRVSSCVSSSSRALTVNVVTAVFQNSGRITRLHCRGGTRWFAERPGSGWIPMEACPGGSAVNLKVNVLPVVSPSVTVSEVGSNVTPPVSSSMVFTDTVTASSASYSAAPVSSAGVSSSTS